MQTSAWERAVSVDRKLLAADTSNPELHLDLIEDLIKNGKADDADAALAQLRQMPSVRDDPRLEIKAVKIAFLRGDNHAQEQHAELALKLAQARDDTTLAADAIFDLALARYALGQTEEGVKLMQQAVEAYRNAANPGFEADARVNLAWMRLDQGGVQAARDEYQSALAIYARIDKKSGLGDVYKNLAILLWNEGDRDAAEQAVRQVREISDEIGNSILKAWALAADAWFEMDETANDAVLQGYREALALSEQIGAHEQHIYTLQNYAEALRLRGELPEAAKACSEARKEAMQSGFSASASMAELRCALVALDRGDIAAAVTALEEVRDSATKMDAPELVATSAIELARIDIANQRWAEASEKLQLAIDKSTAWPVNEAFAQSLLAQCRVGLGDNGSAGLALARAHELRSRITARGAVFLTDLNLALLDAHDPQHGAESALALGADADKRSWTGLALEARLAALFALETVHVASAAALREQIGASARQHGYGWVLARLNATRPAKV